MRGIDRPDAALPGGIEVDPLREPVALQFTDDPQLRRALHHLGVDQRRAVADDDAVHVADAVEQLRARLRIRVRAETRAAVHRQPLPVRELAETLPVGGSKITVVHVLIEDEQHLRAR